MKSSASESQPSKVTPAKQKEWLSHSKLKQAFLIDSDAKLFIDLIQCIKFGS